MPNRNNLNDANNLVELNEKRIMFFCHNQFSYTDGISNFGELKNNANDSVTKKNNPSFFHTYLINKEGVIFNSQEQLQKQDEQFLSEVNRGRFDNNF